MKHETFVTCPVCGCDERTRDCSVNPAGLWHCFRCNSGGKQLPNAGTVPAPVPAQPKRLPAWRTDPALADALVRRIVASTERYAAWARYKPLDPRLIYTHQMGTGTLDLYPWLGYHTSRCQHNRLLVPVYDGAGTLIAVRGRRIDCACVGDSWLNLAGSVPYLYGVDDIPHDATVILCENMIDALLVHQYHPSAWGAATTGGAGTWRDDWTRRLIDLAPARVIVWYDNDLAGSPNQETLTAELDAWREKMRQAGQPATTPPQPNGPRVLAKLRAAGLPATAGAWPSGTPRGWDVGKQIAHEKDQAGT